MNYLPTGMAVYNFLQKQDPDSKPWAHWMYAETVEAGRPFYSTDDKTLLHFSKELEEQFGVPILTHQEAVAKHKVRNHSPWVKGPLGYDGPFAWGVKEGTA